MVGLFFLLTSLEVVSQSCRVPFSISFSERTTTSIHIKWFDSNTNPMGWQIEIVKRGNERTGLPTGPIISSKEFTIKNLEPATSYELYIRTACSISSFSEWNVAIPFVTVLNIPTNCGLNIPLKDNGTEVLLLDVKQTGILGENIFIEGIDMVVAHDWPADLKIIIESPQGQQLILSNHNGTSTDDFGDIKDTTCNNFTTFKPLACQALKDGKPPYIGEYRPDDDINNWVPDTLSKGFWKIIFLDRALKDVGTLRYLNIRFNSNSCLIPNNFNIINTNAKSITVGWKSNLSCKSVKIVLHSKSKDPKSFFVECKDEKFTIDSLESNETYELSISSVCSLSSLSQESCFLNASTSCETISHIEKFDSYSICTATCNGPCNFGNTFWYNSKTDGDQDWVIFSGKTDTENTGPSGDVNGTGNYIYIENNPSICNSLQAVELYSKCIHIQSNPSGCDMSFYYHAFGLDISFLKLEISTDNGTSWDELFYIEGNQGDIWKKVFISLQKYNNKLAMLRFSSKPGKGVLGDIAIDQIEFYKSIPVLSANVYYRDKDGDGHGLISESIEICAELPPTGYSIKSGDCDDNNNNIFPGAMEIVCNGIDENCNGKTDDQPNTNPILYSVSKINASCNGASDGSISLNISGGSGPYQVLWNNNTTSTQNTSLKEGIYFATITDSGGCVSITDYFEIQSNVNLNVIATSVTSATCLGKADAQILIEHSSGNEPYAYKWSQGSLTKNLSEIPQGIYALTVTDTKGCTASISDINVQARPSLRTDIKDLTNPLCFGQNKGKIQLISFNGIAPYKYVWSNGNTNDEINNLPEAIYTCTVTDQVGCKNIISVPIKSPPPLTGKVINSENVRCTGEANGSIKTEVTGGVTPYTYLWNNFDFTDDIFNLKAGNYTLTVTDANGCKFNYPLVEVREPIPFVVTVDSVKSATCIFGNNGGVSIQASGGNGDYTYVWGHTQSNIFSVMNVPSGNYSVTAYDKLGCKASISNIAIPYVNDNINIELKVLEENQCYQQKNGKISLTSDAKNAPFDFNWSFGSQYFSTRIIDTIHNLAGGNYMLTITDNLGCTGISNVAIIGEPPPYFYSINQIKNNECKGDSSGLISLVINGGSAPFGTLWNGGLFSGREISKLTDGTYSGFISDAKGCIIQILPITLKPTSDINIVSQITPDINRTGIGKICVIPSSGVGPYIFKWLNFSSTSSCLENLLPGSYTVTITDQLGCTKKAVYNVESVSEIKEENLRKISVFPNPTTETITIECGVPTQKICIYNDQGQEIDRILLNGNTSLVYNSSSLIPGIYAIKIVQEKRIQTVKFIKI